MKNIMIILLFLFVIVPVTRAQLVLSDTTVSELNCESVSNDYNGLKSIYAGNHTITTIYHISRNIDSSVARKRFQYDSVWIAHYDFSGNMIWSKKYALYRTGAVNSIDTISGGGYVLAMNYDNVNAMVLLDSSGNITGSQTYPNPDYSILIGKIRQLPDGRYMYGSLESRFIKIDTIDINMGGLHYYTYYELRKIYYRLGVLSSSGTAVWEKLADSSLIQTDTNSILSILSGQNATVFELDHIVPSSSIQLFYKSLDTSANKFLIKLKGYDLNGNLQSDKLLKTDSVYDPFASLNPGFRGFFNMHDLIRVGNQYLFRSDSGSGKNIYICDDNGSIKSSIDITHQNDSLFNIFTNDHISYIPLDHDSSFLFSNSNNLANTLTITRCSQNKIEWAQTSGIHQEFNPYNKSTDFLMNDLFADQNQEVVGVHTRNTAVYDSIFNGIFNQYLEIAHFDVNPDRMLFKIYIDRNSNGIQDAGDTLFSNALIEVSGTSGTINYPIEFNKNGEFNIFTDTGTYTAKPISYTQSLKYFDILPPFSNTTFHSKPETDTITFRLLPKPNIQDLQVNIVPLERARPGFEADYKIIVGNAGTKTVSPVSVKFIKDVLQTVDTTNIVPNSIINDTLIWELDSLAPLETREFTVYCQNAGPPTLQANDTLHLFAAALPFEKDTFIQDNTFILDQLVYNAYDPNEKIEAHGGTISLQELQGGNFLYYTIRFQNTGTAYASRIRITDTLSDNLDWNTLEILSSSHPFHFKVENQHYLSWWSDAISLPDSTSDEAGSHGYVSFRIKPKAGLGVNDSITNHADIYFDYNSAIRTATISTHIIEDRLSNVLLKEINGIKIFPSPGNGMVSMEFESTANRLAAFKVSNVNGQEIYIKKIRCHIGKNEDHIDISSYPVGIYFIRLIADDQTLYYGKLVKQ